MQYKLNTSLNTHYFIIYIAHVPIIDIVLSMRHSVGSVMCLLVPLLACFPIFAGDITK